MHHWFQSYGGVKLGLGKGVELAWGEILPTGLRSLVCHSKYLQKHSGIVVQCNLELGVCHKTTNVIDYTFQKDHQSDGRSNVTDSLECPDKFRVP